MSSDLLSSSLIQPRKNNNSMVKLQHLKFPYKLHYLLEEASQNEGLSGIVSWLPCGTAFTVHDAYAFANLILPTYFPGMASYRSFRRQLNLYGITQGNNNKGPGSSAANSAGTGVYSHPFLIRSRRDLCGMIQRRKNPAASTPGVRTSKKDEAENKPVQQQQEQLDELEQEEEDSINFNFMEKVPAPSASAEVGGDLLFKNLFMDDGFNLNANNNTLNNIMINGGSTTTKERFTMTAPEVHLPCQPIHLVNSSLLFPSNNNTTNTMVQQQQTSWMSIMGENNTLDLDTNTFEEEIQKPAQLMNASSKPSSFRNPLADLFSMEDEIIWAFKESS